MLSSGNNRTIRSYTSSSVALTAGPFLQSSGGVVQICCDGAGTLYVSNGGGNYVKVNPVTGVVTAGLASGYSVFSLSVTLDGVVFFAASTSVYAVGGSYGSSPVLLFAVTGGVLRQSLYVDSKGTAVYCIDNGSLAISKYTAWSGGTATRTVLSGLTPGEGYTALAGTDGGMLASGASGYGSSSSEIIPRWYGPLADTLFTSLPNSYYTTDYNNRLIWPYGVAIDSDMSVLYVTGGNPEGGTTNNAAALLRRFPPGNPGGITIPITAWAPYGVAVHPLTRAIYVISYGLTDHNPPGGTYSYITTLTPNY